MRSDILAWLNSDRNYAAGLQLFEQYGKDPALLIRLTKGPSDTLKRSLFFALKELLQAKPGLSFVLLPSAPNVSPKPTAGPDVSKKEENPASIEAKRDADRLYKEMQNTRALLLAMCPVEPSPDDRDPAQKNLRGSLAKAVMALQYQVNEAYADYYYALAHGQRREKPPVEVEEVDPVKLYQTITNLQKRLSKLRKQEPTENRLQLIAEKEALLKQYKQQYESLGKPGPAE